MIGKHCTTPRSCILTTYTLIWYQENPLPLELQTPALTHSICQYSVLYKYGLRCYTVNTLPGIHKGLNEEWLELKPILQSLDIQCGGNVPITLAICWVHGQSQFFTIS